MSAPSKKKLKGDRAKSEIQTVVLFPEVSIFIVERKIQRIRFEHLKKIARKWGFCVVDSINSEKVSHIVSELDSTEEVRAAILSACKTRSKLTKNVNNVNVASVEKTINNAEMVSMDWFTACMEERHPVEVLERHRIKAAPKEIPSQSTASEDKASYHGYQDARFACQRRTTLNNHNKKLTDAIHILERQAEYLGGDQNHSRALAFGKAACALKALPQPVRRIEDLNNLYDLSGKHTKKVIQEIIEDGFSMEIDDIREDKWFHCMETFTGVFGCGSATARKWYDSNLRTLDDVIKADTVSFTKEQKKGIEFYNDLNTPVTRLEADIIRDLVVEEVSHIVAGATVVITGGFLRGKDTGHDVDLLISHPDEGKEEHLLADLLEKLTKRQLLEYIDIQNNSFSKEVLSKPGHARRSHLDHYERCFSIFRLSKQLIDDRKISIKDNLHPSKDTTNDRDLLPPQPKCMKVDQPIADDRDGNRSWVARRVDLIVAPASQYPYAVMGWTGSKMFNRSIRDYANKEMNMTLTSHGLYDKVNNKSLPAKTEKDIFDHLHLEYREPCERNC